MSIFQKSIVDKYLKTLDDGVVEAAFDTYKSVYVPRIDRIQLIKAVLPYLISKQKNIEDLQQEQPLFQIEIIGSLSKN